MASYNSGGVWLIVFSIIVIIIGLFLWYYYSNPDNNVNTGQNTNGNSTTNWIAWIVLGLGVILLISGIVWVAFYDGNDDVDVKVAAPVNNGNIKMEDTLKPVVWEDSYGNQYEFDCNGQTKKNVVVATPSSQVQRAVVAAPAPQVQRAVVAAPAPQYQRAVVSTPAPQFQNAVVATQVPQVQRTSVVTNNRPTQRVVSRPMSVQRASVVSTPGQF